MLSDKAFAFIWVLFLGLILGENFTRQSIDDRGFEASYVSPLYAWMLFVPIIYMAAFGRERGDVWLYMHNYRRLPVIWSDAIELIRSHSDSGRGFYIFETVISVLTNNSETAFRLIVALCHTIPLISVFRRYSPSYGFSVFMFAALGCHMGWMMNGIRQFLACTMIFAATPLMINKKYIPLIAVILLAYTVHTSAIIMLPIVFVVQGTAWNWKTVVLLLVAVVATYIFATVSGSFDALLENTEYASTMASMQEYGDDGVNPIRVLVYSVPAIMAFLYRREMAEYDEPVINICVNMSIITAAITLIAMVTSGIMVGRLPIYTNMYSFILLPYIFKYILGPRDAGWIKIAASVCYVAFYLIESGW